MQKAIRFSEGQLLSLAACARADSTLAGYLYKRSSDTGKWQQRWFALYQNFLFYFENDSAMRPSGLALIEGCQCERVISTKAAGKDNEKQYLFSISYKQEGQRQYDLRAETEPDRESWVMAINRASYQVLSQQREELEQKYLHLLQIVESEKTAKWQLMQQCEEQSLEIRRLKRELGALRKEHQSAEGSTEEESDDIKKIKKESNEQGSGTGRFTQDVCKVQSFLRGWLCRRRWKSIVQDYIRSPHAESMRKRNQIVFTMVECEEEYVTQLSTLVTCFLRPLKMSASSKKPPITHEDVNSIFLNSETIMFLHQIFYQGLRARMESWPTLVLGDLFDMLLPMLSIYQEYVRNHHYSLQVLAECKHQSNVFNNLLKQYEGKPVCEGRTLETFLTYPMHQIPRYIITLNELLAHTPHDHVERKSLEFAQTKLEELSRVMQDEVSETENIRKSLSIERMIVDGCDILLDVNQTFVRQGTLVQLLVDRGRSTSRVRLSNKDKESARQCFLFSQHLIITTRGSGGKLYLSKVRKGGARIFLMDATLTEDITEASDEESTDSVSIITGSEHESLAFKLTVESKQGPPAVYVLMAATTQEKAAWCSDISQCIDNIHYHGLLNSATEDVSSVLMPQNIRTDARLFNDDVDIRFSRTLNSCKVPQIRYATVERLLERLTDLRFLSIDFLNTFLYTYRVFTSGSVVLEALIRVYRAPETCLCQHNSSLEQGQSDRGSPPPTIPELQASTKRVRSHSTTTLPTILSEDRADNGRSFESNEHIRRHPLRRSFRRNKGEGDQSTVENNRKDDASQERLGTPMHHRPSSPALPVPCRRRSASSTGNVDESGRGRSPSPVPHPSSPVPPSSPRLAHAESAPGVVVTSSRPSRRRSTSSAVVAFAAATAGSANLRVSDGSFSSSGYGSCITSSPDLKQQRKNKEEIISTAATARVLNVLRHWTTKHRQDFEMDSVLKAKVVELLEEMMGDVGLLATEHKAASNILRTLAYEDGDKNKTRLQEILNPGKRPDSVTFETLSALQLAEQLTLTDHTIFCSIPYEEFLNKAWMKPDKATRAPHIMLTSKRFNEVSKLVASEVVSQPTIPGRASAIEKWTAVADICRCMHNYNTVLEITSAFQNSAIYRLKKTWEKVSKQTKQLVEKLKNLVSSDGRFKNMRNELHRCDPPCVPYLGVYLTDLAFIEDGAPNFTEEGLVNFSKMRMIAHVIRELRQYQQTPYKIEYDPKVTSYLLDQAIILDDDALYATSLQIEPRMSPSASASSGS